MMGGMGYLVRQTSKADPAGRREGWIAKAGEGLRRQSTCELRELLREFPEEKVEHDESDREVYGQVDRGSQGWTVGVEAACVQAEILAGDGAQGLGGGHRGVAGEAPAGGISRWDDGRGEGE